MQKIIFTISDIKEKNTFGQIPCSVNKKTGKINVIILEIRDFQIATEVYFISQKILNG